MAAKRKLQRRPTSYAWALLSEFADRGWRLRTADEEAGYEWAQELATAHRARAASFLSNSSHHLPRLTVNDLAERDRVSPVHVNTCIKRARRAMFGTLSDEGIYSRKRRWRRLGPVPQERCAEDGCRAFARQASPRRRGPRPIYCEEHGAGRVRAARCRERATGARKGG